MIQQNPSIYSLAVYLDPHSFIIYHVGDESEYTVIMINLSFSIQLPFEDNFSFSTVSYKIFFSSDGPIYLKFDDKLKNPFLFSSDIYKILDSRIISLNCI
jgi:hypothetical protein